MKNKKVELQQQDFVFSFTTLSSITLNCEKSVMICTFFRKRLYFFKKDVCNLICTINHDFDYNVKHG